MAKAQRLTALDRAQLLTKAFTDAQVRIVIQLDGRVDEARVADAVRVVIAAEPVLACRVQDRFFRPRWMPRPEAHPSSLLRVIAADDPTDVVRRLIVEDLDPRNGPLVSFALVRAERDTIVINLDHTAGDGASVRLLAYLLASAYSHPDTVPAADPERAFARRRFDSLRPFLSEDGKRLRARMPSRKREPSWRFPWGTATERSKRLVIRRVDGARAAAIREFAAAEGAWANDVFLAAYFRALACVAGEGSGAARLTVTVDLRGYLRARERPRIANLASAYELDLGGGVGQSFGDTLAKVRTATQAKRNSRPGLAEGALITSIMDRLPHRLMESFFNSGRGRRGGAWAPWFIDLGVLRPEKLSFGGVAARHAYSVQSFGRTEAMFQIGISTFCGSNTIAVCFQGAAAQEPLVNRFLDQYEAELPTTVPA